MTKRGLSITELLVTVGLIAVAIGVLMVGYGNLRTIAQSTAQNRDQTVLYQAVATFNLMGGDMTPIFSSTYGLNPDEQAAVLTKVMQGGVSDAIRKQRGGVSKLVDSSMVIVPMTTSGGMAILVPSPADSPKTLKAVYPTTTTSGFVVVPKDSPLGGQSLAVDWNMNSTSADRISRVAALVLGGNSAGGARYADNRGARAGSRYVWNEDEGYKEGPTGGTFVPPTGTVVRTPTRLKYKEFYDSEMTYVQYVSPDAARSKGQGIKLLQFYRENGDPISASEIDFSGITLGGRYLTDLGTKMVEGTGATDGKTMPVVNVFIYLNEVLPASEWTQEVTSLMVKAKPTSSGAKGAKDRAPLTGQVDDQLLIRALKENLAPVQFSYNDTSPLPVGESVAIVPGLQDEEVKLPEGWAGAVLDGDPKLDSEKVYTDLFEKSGEGTAKLILKRIK